MKNKIFYHLLILFLLVFLIPLSSPVSATSEFILEITGDGSVIDLGQHTLGKEHYQCIDGNNNEYVGTAGTNYQYDTFILSDHTTECGTINNVTIKTRCRDDDALANGKHVIYTGGTAYYGTEFSITNTQYENDKGFYNHTFETNPATSNAWTWSDIDNVEYGIALKGDGEDTTTCFYLYVVVNYTTILGVTTDSEIDIGYTSATLNGDLDCGIDCNCGFWVGNVSTNSTNFWKNITCTGTYNKGDSFTGETTGLLPSKTYYVRAWTNDTTSFNSSSTEVTFNTLPDTPTDLSVSSFNDTEITLTWTKGTNTTVIVRNTTDPTSATDGIEVYNGTLETVTDTGLTPSATYYYRAYNWNSTLGYSINNASINQTLTPSPVTDLDSSTSVTGGTTMDFTMTWTNGTGGNKTVIRRSYTTQPLTPTDGTEVYNDTNNQTTDTGLTQPAYYTVFSYNTTTGLFSTGVNISDFYVVWIVAYNETNEEELTSFGIFFTNEAGTDTYSNPNCDNPHLVNTSDIPTGDDITVIVNSTGYKDRTYTLDIEITGIYYIYAYLPPIVGETEETTVDHYVIQIIDELNNAVNDALIEVSHYIANTSKFENMTSLYTDGYGQIDLWLIPGDLYKFDITADGYITLTGQDWTPVYIEYSDDRYKTFQLEFEDITLQYPDNPFECISLNGEIGGNTLYINFSSTCGTILNVDVYVYEINLSSNNTVLFGSYSDTDNFSTSFNGINNNNNYLIICFYNHSYWSDQTLSLAVNGNDVINPPTSITEIKDIFNPIFGFCPFGWHNVAMFLFLIAGFYYADQQDAGKILILMGGLMLFLNIWIGFNSLIVTMAGGVIPVLFIIAGLMSLWSGSNRKMNT